MTDLQLYYGKVYRNLNRSSGRKRWASRRIGWSGAGRGKKDEEQCPFEVDGKEIFSNRSKQAKPKVAEKTYKTGDKGQSVRWKAWWRQGNIKCAVSEEYASCWVHQGCHVADEQKAALKKAAGVSGRKDECQVRLKGRERDYWMGTEIGMLGGYHRAK